MAYSEDIDRRISSLVGEWQGVERRKMFGGTCHLLYGNIFCGVHKDRLILRLGEVRAAELLSDNHIDAFDITGRPMKGWVMVHEKAFRTDRELAQLIDQAREFAVTLPAKDK
ncbi:MAG: TfoX/Sxy family protein [Desulfocapsaceae bacterium]